MCPPGEAYHTPSPNIREPPIDRKLITGGCPCGHGSFVVDSATSEQYNNIRTRRSALQRDFAVVCALMNLPMSIFGTPAWCTLTNSINQFECDVLVVTWREVFQSSASVRRWYELLRLNGYVKDISFTVWVP